MNENEFNELLNEFGASADVFEEPTPENDVEDTNFIEIVDDVEGINEEFGVSPDFAEPESSIAEESAEENISFRFDDIDSFFAESTIDAITSPEVSALDIVEETPNDDEFIADMLASTANLSEFDSVEDDIFDTTAPEIDPIEASVFGLDIENAMETLVNDLSNDTILTSRFSGLNWAQAADMYPVTLIGLGGIGSYVHFFLSRIKPLYMYLYDNDVYELGNISGQLVPSGLIGETKVKASSILGHIFSNYTKYTLNKSLFREGNLLTPITITGLDNMTGRKAVFNTWEKNFKDHPEALYIDGRLSAENFQIFAIKGQDYEHMKDYRENHLFGEGEAMAPICSMKQTSHIAGMIASMMVNIYTNFINNINNGFPFYVPYYVEYNANMFDFEVKGDYLC